MLLKLFAHGFGDQVHRQSGSVAGYNGAWLAELRDARPQVSFDLEILRNNFDDPVGLRAASQIVLKISNRNFARQIRCEKCSRLGLFRRLEARAQVERKSVV